MMDEDRIVKIAINGYWRDASPKAREDARWHLVCALTALHEAGLVVEQGWQPIETAPRDGTWFIAYFSGAGGYEIISWQTLPGVDEYAWRRSNFALAEAWPGAEVSHWRPLPAPPVAKADPQ